MAQEVRLAGLGARVHLYVRPSAKDRFVALFRDVLHCDLVERDFGMPQPLVFVGFPDKSGFSVEFSDDAPAEHSGTTLDDAHALRGAWIEFRSPDAAAVHRALRDAGIREFRHAGSTHTYFEAPGGQVFRVLDLDYVGP